MAARRSALAIVALACVAALALGGAAGLETAASVSPQPDTPEDTVTVAVLDTGIDDDHPDLEGRVTGRIDLTDAAQTHPESGTDTNGHGTFMAGVVAEGRPEVELLDVRVVAEAGFDADGATVAEGIDYAVGEADADVILLSLDSVGAGTDAIEDRVAWANAEGAVVVASAGNRGRTRGITTPGTDPGAITVGATAADGELWERSARGPTLDGAFKPELLAPGESEGPRAGGGTARMTGTSVAAAETAGAAATLLAADPDLGPADIEARLTGTARPLGADGHVVGSGSGELDAEAALEPGVAADGIVDFGVLDAVKSGAEAGNETETRRVTLRNHGDRTRELAFEATLRNADTGADADEALTVDRPRLTLAPGETAQLGVELDTDALESGAHAGEIRYSVGGDPRSIAVGAFAGGTVTVDKRALSADGDVDGDELLVFNEADTHTELLEFEDGTASFLAGGGTYVLWSSGVDDPTGSLVLLSERVAVDGDTYVRMDEADTARAGIDAAPIEAAYGPLETRRITAAMRTAKGDGTEELTRSVSGEARTVRVSRDRETAFVTTALLTTESGGDALDGSDVFHLEHRLGATRWASPRTVTPEELETTDYRIARTTVDRHPELQERATATGSWESRGLWWFEAGDRSVQTVHHTPGLDHERHLRLDGWRAALAPPGDVAALSHPFFARASLSIVDGTASIEARPRADGAGTRLYADGEGSLSVAVDGEPVAESSGDDPVFEAETPLADGEELSIRIDGDHPESRLSTRTETEVRVADHEAPLPLVGALRFPEASPTNAVGPGEVSLRIDADAHTAVDRATVWYAAGDPGAAPWEADGDDSAWKETPAGIGYDSLRATLDLPAEADTVSLAAEIEAGPNTVRTATADAIHVGSAPNTSTRAIEGRLLTADGSPADNDTVIATPLDGGSARVADTDAEGGFDLEVPKDDRYDLTYRRGGLWDDETTPDRPDIAALGRVNATTDTTLDRHLPEPTELDVRVRDERGDPVENATVEMTHRAGNATDAITLSTGPNGTVAFGAARGPSLGGEIELAVTAPDEPAFVEATERRTLSLGGGPGAVTADGSTEAKPDPVVLENRPPTAALSTTRSWMLAGTPTTLDAGESDVPAGPAEYRWDLDGDGETDRVTTEPTLRYAPELGVSEPTVTVVDAAGKRDTASVGVRVTAEVPE